VTDDQSASLKKGVEMVLESLTVALKEEGITEIKAEGETFDPNLHQAVQTVPAEDDVAPETIVNVLQKGYQLHDRVLRPAMVVVAQ
jgi:molecular chaperone GrpE